MTMESTSLNNHIYVSNIQTDKKKSSDRRQNMNKMFAI